VRWNEYIIIISPKSGKTFYKICVLGLLSHIPEVRGDKAHLDKTFTVPVHLAMEIRTLTRLSFEFSTISHTARKKYPCTTGLTLRVSRSQEDSSHS